MQETKQATGSERKRKKEKHQFFNNREREKKGRKMSAKMHTPEKFKSNFAEGEKMS